MLAFIGSYAFHNLYPWSRKPNDIDLVGNYDDVMEFASKRGNISKCYPLSESKYYIKSGDNIIEADIAWKNSNSEKLLNAIVSDSETIIAEQNEQKIYLPSLNFLYLLKMSHRYLKNSPHFLKTMQDIHTMRELGGTIKNVDFFKEREHSTYDYGHPKLNVSKNDFFSGDGVEYVYDHDTIHESVKHLEKPAYKYYQPENTQVNVAKKLFFEQPEEIKLYGVLEESYVLALERSIIPFGNRTMPKKSFDIALKKVCTSITSGWFREYSWENYDKVQSLYNENYVERFWNAVDNGVVIKYNPMKVIL